MLDSLHMVSANEHPILSRLDGNTNFIAHLQIEVNQVAFYLTTENKKIFISSRKIGNLRHLSDNAILPHLSDKSILKSLESVLEKMDTTVDVQSRFLGILGPKANPLLRKLLYWFVAGRS